MVKILEKGNKDRWGIEVECIPNSDGYGCGSRLLVEEGDIFNLYVGGNAWETGDRKTGFQCPICGKHQIIKTPYRISSKAKDYNEWKKEGM